MGQRSLFALLAAATTIQWHLFSIRLPFEHSNKPCAAKLTVSTTTAVVDEIPRNGGGALAWPTSAAAVSTNGSVRLGRCANVSRSRWPRESFRGSSRRPLGGEFAVTPTRGRRPIQRRVAEYWSPGCRPIPSARTNVDSVF